MVFYILEIAQVTAIFLITSPLYAELEIHEP